ncbi:8-oxo-dGTP pyrophosphatase MutT (NUDIX family) [Mycetocola sp. CAN_C7]
MQLGGHIDPSDRSVAAAAFREALEEGGLGVTPLSQLHLDVDRHELGDGFTQCDVHWDVGYGAIADLEALPMVSDESEQVKWWPVDELPTAVPDGFEHRLRRVHDAAAARQPTAD